MTYKAEARDSASLDEGLTVCGIASAIICAASSVYFTRSRLSVEPSIIWSAMSVVYTPAPCWVNALVVVTTSVSGTTGITCCSPSDIPSAVRATMRKIKVLPCSMAGISQATGTDEPAAIFMCTDCCHIMLSVVISSNCITTSAVWSEAVVFCISAVITLLSCWRRNRGTFGFTTILFAATQTVSTKQWRIELS